MTTPAGAVAGNTAQAQREAAPRGRADGLFSRKYGPLPGWGWALLAGGGALAYFWWRRRSLQQNTSTGSGYTTTGSGGVTDQLQALQDEIDALQGELATSGTSTTTGGGPGPKPPPGPGPAVKVPKVVGMRATPGIARLKAAGFKTRTNPARRDPRHAWKIVSQTPAPGKEAAKGSTVDLHLETLAQARK